MDVDKRLLIIGEIKHWRKHKLLPEQYCDFLLNLYRTDREAEEDDRNSTGPSVLPGKSGIRTVAWLGGIVCLGLLAIVLAKFSQLGLPLQIGISLLFVVCCYGISLMRRNRSPLLSLGLGGMGSLALLLAGMYILQISGIDEPGYYVLYIGLCGLVWLLLGIAGKTSVLQLCGWVAILFAYGWLLNRMVSEWNWGILQLSWVPLGLLFGWIGWLVHHQSKRSATVMLLVGAILWFAPEIHGLIALTSDTSALLILAILLKGVIGVGAAILLRKKWIEWVV